MSFWLIGNVEKYLTKKTFEPKTEKINGIAGF
jgi:hypothetical protein